MRKSASGLVRVKAISGTHVVFLAFDMLASDANGLLGFAVQRTDLTEDDVVWLRGTKTFASTRPDTAIQSANSHSHPFQAFQWADYSVKPGQQYRYRVVPMYGTPAALVEGEATLVTITTEPLYGGTHEVHFNRAAIASQAFAERFRGMTLDEAGAPAYAWLARDLLPALLRFITQADDASYSLHAAIYELKWAPVLEAFQAAADAGAKVRIIYHAGAGETGEANETMIDGTGIRALCVPRRNANLMHNKFIVLSKAGSPAAVWTGSTNLSRNALHGQLNVGHAIHDPELAQAYLGYWNVLVSDPLRADLRKWAEANNPLPPQDATAALIPVFSPHRGRAVFEWWIDLASTPGKPLFMTFPFGIVKDFRPVFDKDDGVLRFAMLDKYVNGGNTASRAAAIADIERIRRHPNIGMSLGERVFVDWIDGWRKEHGAIGVHANWVHTKFMLIDPLGPKPITFTGSANWSEDSVNTNDENMVLIRGDKRVADIYFGEFMRIFAHHRFRESLARHIEAFGPDAEDSWKPQDLVEDWSQWVPNHFAAGSEHDIKRRYYSGG